MYKNIIDFIRNLYGGKDFIPLHAPIFKGNEKKYLNECIQSTYVSYVGEFVSKFERIVCEYTGAAYAIAVVNGTAALQIALIVSGVENGDEVITQPLTFVATANAIRHANAEPIFIDVEKSTMGMSPESLESFLKNKTIQKNNSCYNKITGKRIKTCVPMHTFGHPCRIDEIVDICNEYQISVIEDAAESLGSRYKGKHTGTFADFGVLSFNGNKTITSGGGGMILTNQREYGKLAKHLTSTGKIDHKWEYIHDMVAYNYRLSNINAALGYAQMEQIDQFLENKRKTAESYKQFFHNTKLEFFTEPQSAHSNYWLNTLIFNSKNDAMSFLEESNENGVMTRPAWKLMNKLEMYKNCQENGLDNAEFLAERIVNIPSGVIV